MRGRSGLSLAALLLAGGCAVPVPPPPVFYYCAEVELRLKDGRKLPALECIPRPQRVPGPDPFDPPA